MRTGTVGTVVRGRSVFVGWCSGVVSSRRAVALEAIEFIDEGSTKDRRGVWVDGVVGLVVSGGPIAWLPAGWNGWQLNCLSSFWRAAGVLSVNYLPPPGGHGVIGCTGRIGGYGVSPGRMYAAVGSAKANMVCDWWWKRWWSGVEVKPRRDDVDDEQDMLVAMVLL